MFAKLVTVTVLTLVTLTSLQQVKASNLMCTYELSANNDYSCNLINQTILIESDMYTETGTHLPGFTYDNVTHLMALQSTTIQMFPSTLIDKFKNLKSVILINVRMQGFTNSINFCGSLSFVMLLLNGISSVPRYIFQNCDQLTDLMLSSNRINFIDAHAFSGLSQLNSLSLTNNQIDYLNPEIFDSTPNLKILHLTSNSIREVSPQTFERLPFLTSLSLNNNSISTWNSTLLQSNPALQELVLDHNEISVLSDNVFSNLAQLKVLRVGG